MVNPPPPPQHTWTHRVEGPGIRDPGNAPLINPTGPYPSPTYRSPLSPTRLSSALDGFRLIQLGPNEWWPTRNPDKRLPGKHNFFITFIQCWTNVEDVGPTLYKCYKNVLCSLGLLLDKISPNSSRNTPPPGL